MSTRRGRGHHPSSGARPRLPDLDPAQLNELSRSRLLAEEDWDDLRISHDLAGEVLARQRMQRCLVQSSQFVGCGLDGARLIDVDLRDCDLSGASLVGANLKRVRFVNCRLAGTLLDDASLQDVLFEDCAAAGLSLRRTSCTKVRAERTGLRDADLYNATFESAQIVDCDLSGALLSATKFAATALHGTRLDGVRGIEDVRGVEIDAEQVHAIIDAILAAHGISVTERPPPEE